MGRDTPPRDPDSPLDLVVIPSELSGMRALWNVALEAEDVTVVDQATRLLNRTHQVCAGYASLMRVCTSLMYRIVCACVCVSCFFASTALTG